MRKRSFAVALAGLSVALTLAVGQVPSPDKPLREYIRVNGRLLAVENYPPSGPVSGGVLVAVNPTSASLSVGNSLSLQASVSGATNPAVTWSMTPSLGTLTASGLVATFTAPTSAPPGAAVTIKATSVEDPTKSAASVVTIHNHGTWGALPIHGTFLNFYRDFDEAIWGKEFDEMAANNINTVMIVSVGHLEPLAGQSGKFTLSTDGLLYPSVYAVAGVSVQDRLGWMLRLADQRNMKVFLGSLHTYGNWKDPEGQELEDLRKYNNLVVREILTKYGTYRSLAGWYFSQELWLNEVKVELDNYSSSTGVNLLSDFITDAKQADPTRPVIAAPFFKAREVAGVPGVTPTQLGAVTSQLLNLTRLDILAPQDGIGAGDGAPLISELGSYFAALKTACDVASTSCTLWSTIETFWNNGDPNNAKWPPAYAGRIEEQLSAVQLSVKGYLEWIFGNDMSPMATYHPVKASRLLYDYGSTLTPEQRPYRTPVSIASYTVTHPAPLCQVPEPCYPDTDPPGKLIDGQGGGYEGSLASWVGIAELPAGQTDPNTVRVVLDLGTARVFTGVRALTLSWTTAGIYHPVSLAVQTSNDGVAWRDFGSAQIQAPNKPFYSIAWSEVNAQGVQARYVRLSFYHSGWMFLNEVEVFRNVPPEAFVVLDPQSASLEGGWYKDFNGAVVGSESQALQWTIDPNSVGTITPDSLDASKARYVAPYGPPQHVQLRAAILGNTARYALATVNLEASAFPPPEIGPMSPNPGAGTTQVFEFPVTIPSEAEPEFIKVMFTPNFSPTNQCMVHFARVGGEDRLWISADDATQLNHTWAASGILGSAATIANSQCRVDLAASSVVRNGKTITLKVHLTALAGWRGVKDTYMAVSDGARMTAWPDASSATSFRADGANRSGHGAWCSQKSSWLWSARRNRMDSQSAQRWRRTAEAVEPLGQNEYPRRIYL